MKEYRLCIETVTGSCHLSVWSTDPLEQLDAEISELLKSEGGDILKFYDEENTPVFVPRGNVASVRVLAREVEDPGTVITETR